MSSLMQFSYSGHVLVFEGGGDYPAERTHKVFQVQDRSAGGKLHVANLGITAKTRTISFNLMSYADYIGLVDWFLNVVNGGEHDFEFTDEYGDSGTVKILNDTLDFAETSMQRYSGSIQLEYV